MSKNNKMYYWYFMKNCAYYYERKDLNLTIRGYKYACWDLLGIGIISLGFLSYKVLSKKIVEWDFLRVRIDYVNNLLHSINNRVGMIETKMKNNETETDSSIEKGTSFEKIDLNKCK